MIQLDTNFLVDVATMGSAGAGLALRWLQQGQTVSASAIAWSEFCNGPLSREQKAAVYAVLNQQVMAFTWREAEEASRLFNLTGRRRGSHADCMIAASALLSCHDLATHNRTDFERFVPFGLRLMPLA